MLLILLSLSYDGVFLRNQVEVNLLQPENQIDTNQYLWQHHKQGTG